MMLTSLLALAISLPSTNPVNMTGSAFSVGVGNALPTDFYYIYTGSIAITNDAVGTVQFNVNYDSNYNEYFYLNYDVNFTDHYYRFECWQWFNYVYNVTGFANFSLYRRSGLVTTQVGSWTSGTGFLTNGDVNLPYAFGGDSDVVTYNFSTDYTYYLDLYVYLSLIPDFDYDELDTNDYQTGYNAGYQSGFEDGQNDGQQNGYDVGYQDGYTDGNRTGYNSGYSAGLSYNGYSFKDLFASIGDTPILMIRRLFGFELFGTSLISVFLSLFTALVVIFVIKRVFK